MERIAQSNGARISYAIDGPERAPALVLSHSLGTSRELWARQASAFASAFRVIRYDTRGHGASSLDGAGRTIADLGRDLLAVLDDAGVREASVCGLSLGGQTALWVAAHVPERIGRIVVANSGATLGAEQFWNDRIALVRAQGMAAMGDRTVGVWFSPAFCERDPDTVHDYKAMLQACSVDGYVAACEVLRNTNLTGELARIRCPTLAIAGSVDMAAPVTGMEFLRDRIAGAQLLTLDAAHLSNVEQADAFTDAVMNFLL
jgi:3-oxoadipate enol-lactonase